MTAALPLPSVGVVVVAHGSETELRKCLEAARASVGVDVDLVLVDNGCTSPRLTEIAVGTGTKVNWSGDNRGFAGGVSGLRGVQEERALGADELDRDGHLRQHGQGQHRRHEPGADRAEATDASRCGRIDSAHRGRLRLRRESRPSWEPPGDDDGVDGRRPRTLGDTSRHVVQRTLRDRSDGRPQTGVLNRRLACRAG